MFHRTVKTRSGSEYSFGHNGCVLRTTADGQTEFLGVLVEGSYMVGQPMSVTVVLRENNEIVRTTWTTTDVTLVTSSISLEEVAA